MIVVSFFTKRIPRDELGGRTWSTINEPPIAHGAIGEDVGKPENQKTPGTMQMQGKMKTASREEGQLASSLGGGEIIAEACDLCWWVSTLISINVPKIKFRLPNL